MGQIEFRPGLLRVELARAVGELDKQIEEVKKTAEGMGITPYQMRDANGGFVYIPLITAKATALAGLAQMQSK